MPKRLPASILELYYYILVSEESHNAVGTSARGTAPLLCFYRAARNCQANTKQACCGHFANAVRQAICVYIRLKSKEASKSVVSRARMLPQVARAASTARGMAQRQRLVVPCRASAVRGAAHTARMGLSHRATRCLRTSRTLNARWSVVCGSPRRTIPPTSCIPPPPHPPLALLPPTPRVDLTRSSSRLSHRLLMSLWHANLRRQLARPRPRAKALSETRLVGLAEPRGWIRLSPAKTAGLVGGQQAW